MKIHLNPPKSWPQYACLQEAPTQSLVLDIDDSDHSVDAWLVSLPLRDLLQSYVLVLETIFLPV
jgi:hypothetical protein